jgi:RNA polymerase sigma factor (TIGR02999 family)
MEEQDRTHGATRLLARLRDGDGEAAHQLLPMVYAEMMGLARQRLAGQRGHTLQPTALAHEAWLKLMHGGSGDWQDRRHFLACAARAMRHILTDHARARRAQKRGGGGVAPLDPLDGALVACEDRALDLVELDDLLVQLEGVDPDLPQVVELRFFGGLDTAEIAEVLGLSSRTVERRWKLARGWLRLQLGDDGGQRS